jgi:replicative DNA helicase
MNMHHRIEPPANIDAECALLGAVIMNNAAYPTIAETGLEARHFYEPINQEIFLAMGKMIDAGKSANLITLKSFITIEMQGEVTLSQYLARLAGSAASVIHAPDFAQAIMIAWARRDMMGIAENLDVAAQQAQEDFELGDSLQALKARLEDCQRVIDGKQSEGMSFALAASTSLQSTMDAVSGKVPVGVDYGMPPVRQMIGPLRGGQLIVIGGLTKHGKSSLAQQIARGAADHHHPIFYYSGEMDAEEISQREKARDTGISTQEQSDGRLSENDLERLTSASRHIGTLQIMVQDTRRTTPQLSRQFTAFVARARSKGQPMPVLIVDSMLHVERERGQGRMTDYEFAAYVTDRLKALARGLDVPVIVLGQLKKNTVEKSHSRNKIDANFYKQAVARRPKASDIYGSCEKDADHVLIVWNPEVILRDMEPAEGSDEYVFWSEVLTEHEGKAEILLSLSRSAKWPTLRRVNWNGKRHHFSFPNDEQRNFF